MAGETPAPQFVRFPNPKSKIETAALYRELFSSEPKIPAVHAGLECGVLSARVAGGLDAVSFGPNIKGNHAPGERVEIRSVQKSYRLLTATLAHLARGGVS
jgi:dipeptidase D